MKKLNNDGMTLIEMLVAMLASLIVISAVGQFMSTGSSQYKNADDEVTLQMEAQTVINQISDMMLEGNNVYFDNGTKTLTIYSNLGEEEKNPTTGVTVIKTWKDADYKQISFDSRNNRLLYSEKEAGDMKAENQPLGDYVTGFECSAKNVGGLGKVSTTQCTSLVKIKVDMNRYPSDPKKKNYKTYSAVNEIALRNELVAIK